MAVCSGERLTEFLTVFTPRKLGNNRLSYGDTSVFVKEITLLFAQLSDARPPVQIDHLASAD